MQATAHSAIVGLLAVMLGSCAWQATPSDHGHVLSEMADTAASDNAKCQSSGTALGSRAHKECRAQPAMAGQRILLVRGLMDYVPGISPMTSLKARLTDEGYNVTMITHLNDGFYKNQYWDAVIGHSQGAIDALRDASDLARYNPRVTIIAVDPPRTSVLFPCVPGLRYLDLHTGEFGLGGGSLSCPEAQNLAMGGLHITLPMRSDAQEQILAYLRQDAPIEAADAEPTHVLAYTEPTMVSLSPKAEQPEVVVDDTSFDARFMRRDSSGVSNLAAGRLPGSFSK
jgi:hypothetical protein